MGPGRRSAGAQIRRETRHPGQFGRARGRGDLALVVHQPGQVAAEVHLVFAQIQPVAAGQVDAFDREGAGIDVARVADRPVGFGGIERLGRRRGGGEIGLHQSQVGRVGRRRDRRAERGQVAGGQDRREIVDRRSPDPAFELGSEQRAGELEPRMAQRRVFEAAGPGLGGLRREVAIAADQDERQDRPRAIAQIDRCRARRVRQLADRRRAERLAVSGAQGQVLHRRPGEAELGHGRVHAAAIILPPDGRRQLQLREARPLEVAAEDRDPGFAEHRVNRAFTASRRDGDRCEG